MDIIDVLVSLRAAEAVPELVPFIWCCNLEFLSLGKTWLSDEAKALTRMGPLAVPKLLEVLETADMLVASMQGETERRQRARLIRIRTIKILTEIADASCLPALRALLRETRDDILSNRLRQAIDEIERKSRNIPTK